jgi:hypothetical protein
MSMISPERLKKINDERHRHGRPPLSHIQAHAAYTAAAKKPRPEDTSFDWLPILVAVEIASIEGRHEPQAAAAPDEGYHGNGGSFGGAGASADYGNESGGISPGGGDVAAPVADTAPAADVGGFA